MLIEIKKDIFNDENFKALNFLVQLTLYQGRYDVFIDLGAVRDTSNFQRLDRIDQETLELEFNRVIIQGLKPKYFVSNKILGRQIFSLEESVRFLAQPVSIVLENSLNDSYFIKKLITLFDTTHKLELHLQNGWLQFENAGGCGNVKNLIEGRMQSYNSLSLPNERFLRFIVILDSDRDFPSAPIKEDYTKLIHYLKTISISLHIFEKRAMENYLPEEVFSAHPDQRIRPWIDAYINLSPEQKDYLNIHKGFKVQSQAGFSSNVRDLFHDLSEVNFTILNRGMAIGDFKTEFPRLMEHHHCHKQTLIKRTIHQDNPKELEEIINLIFELI